MSKRARYAGPSGTGVELTVPLDDGQIKSVHIEHGHQLPTEIAGQPVSAAFRDQLLAQDDWAEVDQTTGDKTNSKAAKTADEEKGR
jgi:hypothetical protein